MQVFIEFCLALVTSGLPEKKEWKSVLILVGSLAVLALGASLYRS